MSQTNPCKVIVLTEIWLADKKAHNNSLFLILNSSLIPQIKKYLLKGGGVVIFIHKSLNYKIIYHLRKEMILLKLCPLNHKKKIKRKKALLYQACISHMIVMESYLKKNMKI